MVTAEAVRHVASLLVASFTYIDIFSSSSDVAPVSILMLAEYMYRPKVNCLSYLAALVFLQYHFPSLAFWYVCG